jgi:type II secretory pathway component PulF
MSTAENTPSLIAIQAQLATLAEAGVELDQAASGTVEAGVRSGHVTQSLDAAAWRAEALADLRRTIRRSLGYPALLLVLAAAGLGLLSLLFAPRLTAIYDQLALEVDPWLDTLAGVRRWMPWWAGALTGLVLWGAWHSWRRSPQAAGWSPALERRLGWVPGLQRYFTAVHHADVAEQLAQLVAGGLTMDEALQAASDNTLSPEMAAALRTLAIHSRRASPGDLPLRQLRPLRPYLRWALTAVLPPEPRAHALQSAANLYRESVRQQAARWRVLGPTLACVGIGGVTVLGYGLCVFVPYVRLLSALSS